MRGVAEFQLGGQRLMRVPKQETMGDSLRRVPTGPAQAAASNALSVSYKARGENVGNAQYRRYPTSPALQYSAPHKPLLVPHPANQPTIMMSDLFASIETLLIMDEATSPSVDRDVEVDQAFDFEAELPPRDEEQRGSGTGNPLAFCVIA
ncbi:hypothetical protein DXG03_005249 [Asterophora parasitica]|uniref:Uncharacterized protein n=1 Tax=Asterophora parasitica TaxID=117018 RepID=A0A9P7G0H9_9AGAR|nr:hypothetical protein DXG03_005249 [Asterophora parasitica]